MKILIIHSEYQHEGGEDVVVRQEQELLKHDHETRLLLFKNRKGIIGAFQTFLSPWNIFAGRKIKKAIRSFQPDVVHLHNTHYSIGPIVIHAVKTLDIPLVMTLHNYRLLCPSAILAHNNQLYFKSLDEDFPWSAVKDKVHVNSYIKTFWLAFTYWIHRKAGTWNLPDKYIVFSDFAKANFLRSRIHIDENKFVVKPNSVPDYHSDLAPKDDTFLYLGRLSEEKGILPLLNGVAGSGIKLRIAGDGPLKADVLKLIQNDPNIHYMGKIGKTEVINTIDHSTALVLPSVCLEGMPISVLEAFSLGNVAIVCDLGVLKEMVKEHINGFRFDPNDPEDIRQTLRKWLNMPEEERNIMRKHAREQYQLHYTDEKNVETLNRIYHELTQLS